MEFSDYTLKAKGKTLLDRATFSFEKGRVSHIVGRNGSGKSTLAKDLLMNNSGQISSDIQKNTTVICSFSNIPSDLTVAVLLGQLKKRSDGSLFKQLYDVLGIADINERLLVNKLSDGQKQKLKLLVFLCEDKNIIVLDEITNALDKKTTLEVYAFFNEYVKQNPEKYILNITHNLQDLEYIKGAYYLLHDYNIEQYTNKEIVIDQYVKGV